MSQSDAAADARWLAPSVAAKIHAPSRADHPLWRSIPRDHATLLAELQQTRLVSQQRINRVRDLEQALDQALSCLEELRLKVQDQEVLEAQLAMTENFANVQQQAIAQLKQRLEQQQTVLDGQVAETRAREQAVWELQSALDAQQLQVVELSHEALTQQHQADHLRQQLAEAHSQIQALSASLAAHQQQSIQLELPIDSTYTRAADRQNLALTLRRTQAIAAERQTTIAALEKDLAIAQIKVEELEIQIAKHLKSQASWQQRCHELRTECDRYQARITDLEQEVFEMQEQIFQQAQQKSEYEAAVQHWKDRYLASQQQIAQFKALLDRALPPDATDLSFATHIPLTPALLELLNAIDMTAPSANPSEPKGIAPLSPLNQLELPEFLIRRRNYRVR
ncbi:MAG TPA: hypothetical protein V6C88_13115 [Chroococcidiopsis sp.]